MTSQSGEPTTPKGRQSAVLLLTVIGAGQQGRRRQGGPGRRHDAASAVRSMARTSSLVGTRSRQPRARTSSTPATGSPATSTVGETTPASRCSWSTHPGRASAMQAATSLLTEAANGQSVSNQRSTRRSGVTPETLEIEPWFNVKRSSEVTDEGG